MNFMRDLRDDTWGQWAHSANPCECAMGSQPASQPASQPGRQPGMANSLSKKSESRVEKFRDPPLSGEMSALKSLRDRNWLGANPKISPCESGAAR